MFVTNSEFVKAESRKSLVLGARPEAQGDSGSVAQGQQAFLFLALTNPHKNTKLKSQPVE
jgi:hypothetical protein